MVSWRKLFNKFLFLKSASPPRERGRILFFIFIPWTRFQSPFSFTIHLHSLIRVSRRDKKKHFEIQITRGYSARGDSMPANCTPRGSFCQYTAELHSDRHIKAPHCCDVWSVTPSFLVSKARIRVFLAPTQDERINNGAARTPPVHLSPAFTVSFKFPTYQNFSSVSLCFHSSFQLSFTVLVYYRSLIQYLELSVVYQTFWTLISKNSTLRKHKDGIYHRRPTSSQDCHLVS